VFLFIWIIVKGLPLEKIKPLKYPLMFLVLALIISVVFSYNKIVSIRELYKYISAILVLLISISLSYKDKIRIVQGIALAGFIIALLAIYQYFFGFKHILDYMAKTKITDSFALDYISRKRVFSPFVTPNTLGGYLAMIIPLTIPHKNKIWFIIPLSFALLLTKSLGALLSAFIGLMMYLYLQGRLKKKNIFFLVGLLALIVLVFILRQTATKENIFILPSFSLTMRLNYWAGTLRIIKNSPWTGVGLGNFNPILKSRYAHDYAHNSYLQIWAEMGILGIASFLWLIVMVFKSALKNIKESPNKQQIFSLITASSVFLIHNLVDFSFFLPEVSLIWWIILGLVVF
jgi:putative inorganic carbon (HCO3(-)) transporter